MIISSVHTLCELHCLVQKFKRRTGVVTPVEMERYWQHLNLYYVTEESDDAENPNGIVEHKLPWRAKHRCKEYVVL